MAAYGVTGRMRAQEALERLGYRPEIDHDGDLKYFNEGVRLYVRTQEDDPSYVQVMAACEANTTTSEARRQTLETADRLAKQWKCVKAMVYDNGIFVVDEFVASPDGHLADYTYVMDRATRVVTVAAKSYLNGDA